MRFVIEKNALTEMVGRLQSIVAAKATIPILSNIEIEAKGDFLTLTATDLTVGMRCQAAAKVVEEGATTLPAKRFFSLIKELTCSNVEMVAKDGEMTEIIADSSKFRLRGMNRSDFPSLPDLAGATQFKMSQSALKDLFFRTSFAVGTREENRFTLTGVLAEVNHSIATFVGTDGKRLAKAHAEVALDPSVEGEYIIPLKTVDELVKMLGDDAERQVTLSLMHDKVAVETENTLVISKLLTGEFPDYHRVIPVESSVSVVLHRDELTTLLRQVALFTSDSIHSVRFSFMNGELKICGNTSEFGEGKVSMPVDYTGELLEIAFNPHFFLDILRHCRGETVTLELIDSFNPGKIRDSDDSTAVFVIMPMRLE